MSSPLLSLCIPTNGILELIFPVLESIYSQNDVDSSLFEVVVMDNGDNREFKIKIKDYAKQHKNLVYKETELKGFLSESECYKAASGTFIKFINHRTKLLPNAINWPTRISFKLSSSNSNFLLFLISSFFKFA